LRVSRANPRYFADDRGRPVYLTGSHTWRNFQDSGLTDPPPRFDYEAYLDFLQAYHHNFFRLWVLEQATGSTEIVAAYHYEPSAYARSGPGVARDGKPRFDVTRFNDAYFARLRQRVARAGERGMYVSVMLFDGFSIERKGNCAGNPWDGHPFNRDNNVNGVDGDPGRTGEGRATHTLAVPAVTAAQDAYVRRVVDTVNDLDNVLFEISNESRPDSRAWQYRLIDELKAYEATKPKQHPVGMTVPYPDGDNAVLFASHADWVSPNPGRPFMLDPVLQWLPYAVPVLDRLMHYRTWQGLYTENPPAADGRKVIVTDTDHLWGNGGDATWVWQSFMRGLNPLFMDSYVGDDVGTGVPTKYDPLAPRWVALRQALGDARRFAERIDLATMAPRGELSSTGYCLAGGAPGRPEYLVLSSSRRPVSVDLSAHAGPFTVEWFEPVTGRTLAGGTVAGGERRTFSNPFGVGDAVLYLVGTRAR
jgi:hypothetical protein